MIKFVDYMGTLTTDGNAIYVPGRKGRYVRCTVLAGRNGFIKGEVVLMPLGDFQAVRTVATVKPKAAPKAASKPSAPRKRKAPLPAPTGKLKSAAPSKLAGKAAAKAKEAAALPAVDMTNIR